MLLPIPFLRWRHGDRKGEGSRLDWKRRLERKGRKSRGCASGGKRGGWGQPRVHQAGRKVRRHGETETPTTNQPPHGAQGRRLLGPVALRTCPFASLLSQVRARLGPGSYCWRSRNGGTQTCLPAARGVADPAGRTAHLNQQSTQDPCEGPSLVRRVTQELLWRGLARQAHEECRHQGEPNLMRLS